MSNSLGYILNNPVDAATLKSINDRVGPYRFEVSAIAEGKIEASEYRLKLYRKRNTYINELSKGELYRVRAFDNKILKYLITPLWRGANRSAHIFWLAWLSFNLMTLLGVGGFLLGIATFAFPPLVILLAVSAFIGLIYYGWCLKNIISESRNGSEEEFVDIQKAEWLYAAFIETLNHTMTREARSSHRLQITWQTCKGIFKGYTKLALTFGFLNLALNIIFKFAAPMGAAILTNIFPPLGLAFGLVLLLECAIELSLAFGARKNINTIVAYKEQGQIKKNLFNLNAELSDVESNTPFILKHPPKPKKNIFVEIPKNIVFACLFTCAMLVSIPTLTPLIFGIILVSSALASAVISLAKHYSHGKPQKLIEGNQPISQSYTLIQSLSKSDGPEPQLQKTQQSTSRLGSFFSSCMPCFNHNETNEDQQDYVPTLIITNK